MSVPTGSHQRDTHHAGTGSCYQRTPNTNARVDTILKELRHQRRTPLEPDGLIRPRRLLCRHCVEGVGGKSQNVNKVKHGGDGIKIQIRSLSLDDDALRWVANARPLTLHNLHSTRLITMSGWMAWLAGKGKNSRDAARDAIVTLREQLLMLEKKEQFLQKKIDDEVAKAKANATSNKRGE